MIALTQITNTEDFPFIDFLDFQLLSPKVLFTNRKENRKCYKVGHFLRNYKFQEEVSVKL